MKKVGERPDREFAARAASMMMFTRQRDQSPLNHSPAFTPPSPVSLLILDGQRPSLLSSRQPPSHRAL
ncbi:hypothetical protein [Aeromonas rivipollensis]|uniref:hypothetical protein n=1 Tax=Aeromonas rivipollensis TaxID=948519 RepID=UPI0038D0A703